MLEIFSPLATRIFGDVFQDFWRRKRRLPWKSVRDVSGRLDQVIRLAAGRGSQSTVLTYLVEAAPGLTLTQLEKARTGALEPSIELVRQTCRLLSASYDYIWRGQGAPFAPQEEDYLPVCEYIALFRNEDLESIWFVRGDTYPHPAFILLRYNEYRYRVLPHLFHVSAKNGNGGADALSDLADLTCAYHALDHKPIALGLEANSLVVDLVMQGDQHATALFHRGSKRSYWWDDLADIEHKRPCAREYQRRYDQEFFNAQRLIAWSRQQRSTP